MCASCGHARDLWNVLLATVLDDHPRVPGILSLGLGAPTSSMTAFPSLTTWNAWTTRVAVTCTASRGARSAPSRALPPPAGRPSTIWCGAAISCKAVLPQLESGLPDRRTRVRWNLSQDGMRYRSPQPFNLTSDPRRGGLRPSTRRERWARPTPRFRTCREMLVRHNVAMRLLDDLRGGPKYRAAALSGFRVSARNAYGLPLRSSGRDCGRGQRCHMGDGAVDCLS